MVPMVNPTQPMESAAASADGSSRFGAGPTRRQRVARRVTKIVALLLTGLIVLSITGLFVARGVHAWQDRLPGGVAEKTYVRLGGIEQYVNIRGASVDNPVVIWLHGGPGEPVSFLTTTWQQRLVGEFTFIQWDQRGCGRTFEANPDAQVSMDLLLGDLNDLVDYATQRFHQPVYVVGHSWGTALGSLYAATHAEKIAGYVGIGQLVSATQSDNMAARAAEKAARAAGHPADADEIAARYQTYLNAGLGDPGFDLKSFSRFQQLTAKYLAPSGKDVTLTALASPDFGWADLRWQWLVMTNTSRFVAIQTPLYKELAFFVPRLMMDVPVAIIQGENDYVCNTRLAQLWFDGLVAPTKNMFIMPGLGHSPMVDDPAAFADTLRQAITSLR